MWSVSACVPAVVGARLFPFHGRPPLTVFSTLVLKKCFVLSVVACHNLPVVNDLLTNDSVFCRGWSISFNGYLCVILCGAFQRH